MALPRSRWALVIALTPFLVPGAAAAQASAGLSDDAATEGGPTRSKPATRGAAKKPVRNPHRSTIDDSWNPYYLQARGLFIDARYSEALPVFDQAAKFCFVIPDETVNNNDYLNGVFLTIPLTGFDPREWLSKTYQEWSGVTLAALGRYDEAERRLAETSVYSIRWSRGLLSTCQGVSLQGVAFLHAARGRYDEAAELYRTALKNIEGNEWQKGTPAPTCVALILAALANVEIARGRLDAAESCIRRAAAIQEAQEKLRIERKPQDRAAVLTVFAHLRLHQGRYSEAYDLDADALALIREIRRDHPLAGFCLDGMGEVELVRKHFDLAEEHFREALKVREAGLGKDHRELASSLDGLGRVAAARGDRKAAEDHFDRATTILIRALGPAHPDTEEVTAHSRALGPRPESGAGRPAARFLAIPTLPSIGWQDGYHGKDWRPTAASLLRKEARAAKGAGPAPTPVRPAPPSAGR